jgi:hypothetical protein
MAGRTVSGEVRATFEIQNAFGHDGTGRIAGAQCQKGIKN